MKVLSIIHTTQPGGVQRVAIMETAWLNSSGHVGLIASIVRTRKWDLFEKMGINPIYISKNEILGRLFAGLTLGPISSLRPDVIVAHNLPSFQITLMLKQKLKTNIPIIFYLHDSLTYTISGSIYGALLNTVPTFLRRIEAKYIKESAVMLVNSNVTLRKVTMIHKFTEIPQENLKILYPTMNKPLKKRELIQNKQKYILIVGRIDHEAFYNLAKIIQLIDIPLVIAGYGHLRNPNFREILNIFRQLQHKGKNITFVFLPSDEKLLNLYKNASLFVYPGHENFNMSAIEAMSAGCPILVADTSGICEILPQKLREELCLDKSNIKLWAERIQEIVKNDRSYELGKKCWKITHQYNLNTHMARLIKILEGLY